MKKKYGINHDAAQETNSQIPFTATATGSEKTVCTPPVCKKLETQRERRGSGEDIEIKSHLSTEALHMKQAGRLQVGVLWPTWKGVLPRVLQTQLRNLITKVFVSQTSQDRWQMSAWENEPENDNDCWSAPDETNDNFPPWLQLISLPHADKHNSLVPRTTPTL